MISNRYGKANNRYMGSKFDKTEDTRFIERIALIAIEGKS